MLLLLKSGYKFWFLLMAIDIKTQMKLHKLILLVAAIFWPLLVAGAAEPPYACHSSDPLTKSYPFCDTKLPINQRVQDIIPRLSLDEKISQLVNTASIPRLGIPAYQWWSEGLHGIAFFPANSTYSINFKGKIRAATSFPQVILSAAAFDPHLWYSIGQAIGVEARALYNAGQSTGMTFWAPNINIYRDPRWGRGQETPGEDPALTGSYAMSYVRGIQGDSFEGGKLEDGNHLQASACCKHFTAYDLDNWKGINRFSFDARVSKQDLADTYNPPFESCIREGEASGIMCAYNRVNGVPNCADYDLLSKTARAEWRFNGYIVSDCDAVQIMYENQGYAKSPEDAVAKALIAGMDVNCGDYMKDYTGAAVKEKKLTVSDIDRALHNLFSVRMRLGLFDGNPAKLPYGNIPPGKACSKEHQDLALQAAQDSIVLLKNANKLLPLSKTKTKSLAVIGPNADTAATLLGNYNGPPCKTVTPLQGFKSYVKNIKYHTGCNAVNCTKAYIKKAVEIAKGADNVVLVMGLDQTEEGEGFDRVNLVLPGKQQKLISAVATTAKKPVVLVLLSGGPVDISFAKDDQRIGSILWAGYPGEAGGLALAQIIFGDHNPGGRLPVTWYPQKYTRVNMTDMRMRPDKKSGYPGRTYRFHQGPTVFEFGFGLSYSNYSYENFSYYHGDFHLNQHPSTHASSDSESVKFHYVSDFEGMCLSLNFYVTVGVKNSGQMGGKHPVLLFIRQGLVGNGRPIKRLIGFQSVKLNAGETKTDIGFLVSPCMHFARANEDGRMIIEEGSYFLSVGDQVLKYTF